MGDSDFKPTVKSLISLLLSYIKIAQYKRISFESPSYPVIIEDCIGFALLRSVICQPITRKLKSKGKSVTRAFRRFTRSTSRFDDFSVK